MEFTVTWVPAGTTVLGAVAALGPLAVLISLVVTVSQRSRADRRAEWWRRAQWAMDHAMSEDDERSTTGYDVLHQLVGSTMADKDARELFQSFVGLRLDELQESGDTEGVTFTTGDDGDGENKGDPDD